MQIKISKFTENLPIFFKTFKTVFLYYRFYLVIVVG